MRSPILLAVAAAGVLALAACGGGGDTGVASDDPSAPATGAPTQGLAPPADLGEGVAATVDGEEIAADDIDQQVERLAQQPQFAQGPEGEQLDEEQVRETLRSQVLTQAILGEVILQGADELDAAPTAEDVAAARDDLVEQIGGEEAFEQQVDAAGFTEAELERELRVLAAIDLVGERLVEEGETDTGGQTPPQGGSPRDLAVQQWLMSRIQEADVQVDQAYGRWDAAAGQVVPQSA